MKHVDAEKEPRLGIATDEAPLEELNETDLVLVGGGAFPFIQQ